MLRKDRSKIKKLNKKQLLELLLDVTRENEELKKKISQLEKEMNEQTILLSESGSIVEVNIKVKGILDVIENSTLKYIESKNKIKQKETFK